MSFRSLLFVPGARPDRFQKAVSIGADAVCIDLEDAVPPGQKDAARHATLDFIAQTEMRGLGVRINAVHTPDCMTDLRAIGTARKRPGFVMIAKVDSAQDLALVRQAIGEDAPLWPIIESAEGLRHAWEIASADAVAGVLFGAVDFAADLGCTMDWEPLLYARGALAAAAARGHRQLLDSPFVDVRDLAGLEEATARARAMGFTGRACIHPDQVPVVNRLYTPSAAEITQARRVLNAFNATGGGPALLDGKLIELPVVRQAVRVLERAGEV